MRVVVQARVDERQPLQALESGLRSGILAPGDTECIRLYGLLRAAYEPSKGDFVDGAIVRERRDEGGEGAAQQRPAVLGTGGGPGGRVRLVGGGRSSHGRVLSSSDGIASDELVDDRVEGMESGGARRLL